MTEIIEAINNNQFKIIENLARKILPEVYDPIIPNEHTQFFIEKFQTVKAIKNQINFENYKYFLLQFQNQAVGYLGIQILMDKIELSKLYILKSFRGKKIGKTALLFVDNMAIEKKLNTIELTVNSRNPDTINIYKKNGYRISETIIDSFENGHSEENYRMKKIIESKNQ